MSKKLESALNELETRERNAEIIRQTIFKCMEQNALTVEETVLSFLVGLKHMLFVDGLLSLETLTGIANDLYNRNGDMTH